MHTQAVAHDIHRAHPLTLLVEAHLRRMHSPRRSQIAYQQQPIGLRIPLRMLHCLHLPWQPLFAMQALFEMPASQQIAVRNRACLLVPFSATRAAIKRISSLLYLHSIVSRDLWPAVFHHELICKWLRKACQSWIQNSGMHVAATHTDRYKVAPSRILPRQTSPLKPMHCRSSLSLPWLPYARCSGTHIPSDVAATHANDFLFLLIFLFG